ncbi:hypothetical protein F53441_5272 [Fusarium austroafricanum]|uniref:Uncharacterized protein n=1 Tax=Fusarium austroafricanum TaxID=2364996 RepID=A0A8H4KK49_9HYPO|nr:hypothetical protein F53441_5272 [Fusarium austroafricanum]
MSDVQRSISSIRFSIPQSPGNAQAQKPPTIVPASIGIRNVLHRVSARQPRSQPSPAGQDEWDLITYQKEYENLLQKNKDLRGELARLQQHDQVQRQALYHSDYLVVHMRQQLKAARDTFKQIAKDIDTAFNSQAGGLQLTALHKKVSGYHLDLKKWLEERPGP